MRAFIVGPTGSGKTFAARRMATEHGSTYVDYDGRFAPAPIDPNYMDYPKSERMTPEMCRRFLCSVGVDFVMDNVPRDPGTETINEWLSENGDAELFCVVPDSMESWLARKPAGNHKLAPWMWDDFWFRLLPSLEYPVTYLASPGGAVISREEAMSRIGMASLIRRNMGSGGYDHRYQDIREIGHVGYSGTEASWGNIKPLVDWEGASVVDCGSFHGYMLFRSGDEGAGERWGLDFLEPALKVSRAVNVLRGDTVRFRKWSAGQDLPESDVTLCLNALHHFEDHTHPLGTHCPETCKREDFYATIRSPVTIFEAYRKHRPEFERHWDFVSEFSSDREGRSVYLCRRSL